MSSHAISTPVGRVSFRVDYYTDENRWKGRIQHVLSRETAVIESGNSAPLLAFITRHLPPLSERSAMMLPAEAAGTHGIRIAALRRGAVHVAFHVQRHGDAHPARVLSRGTPCEVTYELSSDDDGIWDQGLWCELNVFARPIAGGEVQHLRSASVCLDHGTRRGVIQAESPPRAGCFRLELVARVMDQSGALHSVAGSWDHGVVAVL